MKYYLKEMRVHHYIKNIMIFTALVCSGNFFEIDKLCSGVLGFVAFCMMASLIYVINDIQDVEKDRNHPTKCNRPIASGKISINNAKVLTAVLFIASFTCNAFVFRIESTLLLLLYLVLNIAYSYKLKNIPIVDLAILVSGFLIRILYGAIVTDITISNWLYLTVIAAAFYLALGKRRNELEAQKTGETRTVLKFYTKSFLNQNMYMCLGLANCFYALWTMDKGNLGNGNEQYLIWTVPLVLLIFMKYSLNIEGESDGDPVEVLVRDKVLLLLCVLYGIIMMWIIYC